MLRFALSIAFVLVILAAALVGASSGQGVGQGDCSTGMLPHPDPKETVCLPVTDISDQASVTENYPDLADQREDYATGMATPASSDPLPGGVGAGVFYKEGHLPAPDGADFLTGMVVYPSGMPQLTDYMYTTATNRSDFGVEVLGSYYQASPGRFKVFDWACHRNEQGQYEVQQIDPCTDPGSAWGYDQPLSGLGCQQQFTNLLNGDWHFVLWYHNVTQKLDAGSPPLWENRVLVFNACTTTWDIVYSHQYRVDSTDCGSDPPPADGCGGWAGIIETFFPQPFPDIPFTGFVQMRLDIPGGYSGFLLEEDTEWSEPPAEWQTSHLSLGDTFRVGVYDDSDADTISDATDPDDDLDGYTDVAESGALLCASTLNEDSFDDAWTNDGCPAVGAPESNCASLVDEDGDGFVNDGCPKVGTYSEGEFNIGTFSLGRCSNSPGAGGAPNKAWPSDLVWGGEPVYNSTLRVDLLDLTSFLAGPRRLDTSPGDPDFSSRWDLVPGPGIFTDWINVTDLTALTAGATGSPPMLEGAKAYNGPPCPW